MFFELPVVFTGFFRFTPITQAVLSNFPHRLGKSFMSGCKISTF